MEHWFTADPHFNHTRIIELCRRPFKDIEEMNRHLIDAYNKKIKTNDYLYLLGDFAWGDIEGIIRFRNMIRCENIVLIWGNHDKTLRKNKKVASQLFPSHHDILDIKIADQFINLCHYPMLEWNHFFHGAWHLFGHVHGNLSPLPGALACDVGVDCHNYQPVSFPELSVIMERRKSFNAASLSDGLRPRIPGENLLTVEEYERKIQ
jgi:calcineurin-like phosphoesterase family protein